MTFSLVFPWEKTLWFDSKFKELCSYGCIWWEGVTIDADHDDVIKWIHFPRYWPFVRGIHQSPMKNASDVELWCFLWSAHWINGWAINHEASDLRRHCTHYDVIVMNSEKPLIDWLWILIPVCMHDNPQCVNVSRILNLHLIVYSNLYVNGLVKDCTNLIANALELLQFCTKPPYDMTIFLPKYLKITPCLTHVLYGVSLWVSEFDI